MTAVASAPGVERRAALAVLAWMAMGSCSPASAQRPPDRVNTLDALGPALAACFVAPDGSAGAQITVRLSLTRSGAVLGRPRITYSHLVGSDDARRRFVQAVLQGLDACTPVRVTPALGDAIAGRVFTLRFVGGGPASAV